MAADTSLEQDELVWCRACGIPHDAGAVYCSFCNRPMVPVGADEQPTDADGAPNATGTTGDSRTGDLARAVAARAAQGRPPHQRSGMRWQIARRPAPLTDDEIEARAAAIVALARAEEEPGPPRPRPADAGTPSPLDEAKVSASLDFLPPLRERDQLWLVAGLICCAFLLLFAVGLVRFLAG